VVELPKYVCIHGHFYQPPRENPWLEEVEVQESAYPFHDWNQKINEECYTPNTRARVLDEEGRLRKIINNYEYISFDFGPTLLAWLEGHAPETYHSIIAADAASRKQHAGHGNAMAGGYNHVIMPLASARDKITQIIWGIEDFQKRFHRDPEGMWLPETAVDRESLEIMAEHGIVFTILAPRQASKFRNAAKDHWTTLNSGSIDPSRPYRCHLSHGRSIALFFYDGPVSQAIAFEELLKSGAELKNRLLAIFSQERSWPQLAHIATDGESYGHHHRFGEMALAFALEQLLTEPTIRLTNYGEFLEKHPPNAEVSIIEKSSWSCAHGVGRWSYDCGCSVSQRSDWNQNWREPLRTSLDLIRDRMDRIFIEHGATLLKDPWGARNRYLRVVLDNRANVSRFVKAHAMRKSGPLDQEEILKLLEMQRNRMLMYTSCGWFFDDIAGIESLQILRYAARAMQLAYPYDPEILNDFLAQLSLAQSNEKPHPKGDRIFSQQIIPQVTDLAKVAAHIAILSVFEERPTSNDLRCYHAEIRNAERQQSGERILVAGRISVSNLVTGQAEDMAFALIYFGGVDLRCSVGVSLSEEKHREMTQEVMHAFRRQSTTEVIRRIDKYFPGRYFSLGDLFVEQRRKIIDRLTRQMFNEQSNMLAAFYAQTQDLARIIMESEARLPDIFLSAAKFALDRALVKELEKVSSGAFPDGLAEVLAESRFWKIELDLGSVDKRIKNRILNLISDLRIDPGNQKVAQEVAIFLDLAANLEIPLDLSEPQVLVFRIIRNLRTKRGKRLPPLLPELARRLAVRVEEN
jgi:alpha-amylase/alpha-mannosidase (GH57 family)